MKLWDLRKYNTTLKVLKQMMILLKEKLLMRNVKSLKAERLIMRTGIYRLRERERERSIFTPLAQVLHFLYAHNFVFFTHGIKKKKNSTKMGKTNHFFKN